MKDLGQAVDDPDFPVWKARTEKLFQRYVRLRKLTTRPLGEGWPDEGSCIVDEVLNTIERKIKAAEEVLGLTD